MFKHSLIALTLLTAAAAATAHADSDVPDHVPGPTTTTGDVFEKGTVGFSIPISFISSLVSAASEPVPTLDIVYFLDAKAALDIIVGINLHKETIANNAVPPMEVDNTLFGFAAGLGYRMYTHKDKLHAFIEPEGVLIWSDTSNSAAFGIRLAGLFGAERTFGDWFSLSGAIGGAVNFENKFKDIQVAPTAQVAANFYWK